MPNNVVDKVEKLSIESKDTDELNDKIIYEFNIDIDKVLRQKDLDVMEVIDKVKSGTSCVACGTIDKIQVMRFIHPYGEIFKACWGNTVPLVYCIDNGLVFKKASDVFDSEPKYYMCN